MIAQNNLPTVKIGIVGVSRDCFPMELTVNRLRALTAACTSKNVMIVPLPTIIENESHTMQALADAEKLGVNAMVIYLGNFGPEGPTTIFVDKFKGPCMLIGAAEERADGLVGSRGDAYCGMLNASYNLGLRNLNAYIPETPIGMADELVNHISHFSKLARLILGIKNLKIFSFGPRPHDFYACNAPIKPLYDLGIEVMENSELDLFDIFRSSANDSRIEGIAKDMANELGHGNTYPDLLKKMAQFEIALVSFMEKNLGSRSFGVFANKCWPAFEKFFGFVPCYVNSRLATRGIPVACEVDMYGVLSEYLCTLATDMPATILDINNTVPKDMITPQTNLMGATIQDLFMGFHCGNTSSSCMKNFAIKYQLIMNRLMEDPTKQPDITRGTLEGQIRPGATTIFRLQGTAHGSLASYIAQGNILDIDPRSFGSIAVFAVPNFSRFYRHTLIAQKFPHHCAIAFDTCGKLLFDTMNYLGIKSIATPLPPSQLYPNENPFGF